MEQGPVEQLAAVVVGRAEVSQQNLNDGKVGFDVQNLNPGGGGPVVYISSDPQWGRLSFLMQNNTTGPIQLDTTSLLKVNLSQFLTGAEVAQITVVGPGWTGGPAADGTHLELHPAQPLTLQPNTPIRIEVDGALAAGTPTSGKFRFEYSGFVGVRDGGQNVPGFRQNPPSVANKDWPLGYGFGARPEYTGQGDTIYVTPWQVPAGATGIINYFVLQLNNTDSAPLSLPSGASPMFTISFVSGDTDLSLCSDDQIKVVNVSVVQSDPNHTWITPKNDQTPQPVWTITPKQGNANLFDAGGILGLRFDNLVTNLPSGPGSPVFIQYAGLPGYNDGYTALVLQKTAPVPYVISFEASAGATPLPCGSKVNYGQDVTLRWNVFAAKSCMLVGLPNLFGPVDSFTVKALPPSQTDSQITYQLGTPETEESLDYLQFTLNPPAVTLTADQSLVDPGALVTLTWRADWGDLNSGTLTANGATLAAGLPLSGSRPAYSDKTTVYEWTCTSAAGPGTQNATVQTKPVRALISVQCSVGQQVELSVSWTSQTSVIGQFLLNDGQVNDFLGGTSGTQQQTWGLPSAPAVYQVNCTASEGASLMIALIVRVTVTPAAGSFTLSPHAFLTSRGSSPFTLFCNGQLISSSLNGDWPISVTGLTANLTAAAYP